MTTPTEALEELKDIDRDITLLKQTAAVLEWDFHICMPYKASENRGKQIGLLQKIIHSRITSDQVAELIAKCKPEADADKALEQDFVSKLAEATQKSQQSWGKAKEQSKYTDEYKNDLKTVVSLVREKAELIKEKAESLEPFPTCSEKQLSLFKKDHPLPIHRQSCSEQRFLVIYVRHPRGKEAKVVTKLNQLNQ